MIDQLWATAAVEGCLQYGIDHFFLAPGSRCTPLTLAVARHQGVSRTQHFDERGLAFATLGYGRATATPGVFICTSGTAVANAFPAVIEAAMESIPMLLFTADRPDELRGTGANQTIEQRQIFGNYPRLFLNLPVPGDEVATADPAGLVFLEAQLARAVEAARQGPVHVNWMFREPFTISEPSSDVADEKGTLPMDTAATLRKVESDLETATSDDNQIKIRGNLLIALGNCRPDEANAALALSERLGCPILSDVSSGIRTGSFELPRQSSLPRPDTILHLGGRIVSKSWLLWTGDLDDSVEFIHLTPTGQTINPHGLPIRKIQGSLSDLESRIVSNETTPEFASNWRNAARQRDDAICDYFSTDHRLSEPAIAFHVSRLSPADNGVFLGNSTPIRDMDWYGQGSPSVRFIEANRGASGIDGLLATATGYAAGLERPTTVVLGDLSTLHDLNSLSLVTQSPWPMVVVIINNQSGHIFDLLPIRQSPHFEPYFATPHPYHFEYAARMFQLPYHRVTDLSVFLEVYQQALAEERSQVLEVVTDRELNLQVRQQIRDVIASSSA